MITITNRFLPFLTLLIKKYNWSKQVDFEMGRLVIIHDAQRYDIVLSDEVVKQIYDFLINGNS